MSEVRPVWRVLRWLIVVVLVVANLGVLYVLRKTDSVQAAVVEALEVIPEVEQVLDAPPQPETKDPMTILVLGSDSRENLPDELLDDFGDFAGERADVIMLMQILPEEGSMMLLSIPRDLRVEIEGHGTDKINAAYAYGGASLMVETVRAATGLPIHHYLEVDFVGFSGLVDELGGVELEFAYPARDLKSGLSVEAGVQKLDGRMALAYARSRSYQELRDGQWTSVQANDIGRTGRQQDLVLSILSSVKSPSIVLEAERVIGQLSGYVTVDPAFVSIDFIDLGLTYRSFGSSDIERWTLPTESVRDAGVWYEVPLEPDASEALARFRNGAATAAGDVPAAETVPTTLASLAPADLAVQVLNGNGVPGAAGVVADELAALGFIVEEVTDADSFTYDLTVIIAAEDAAGALIHDSLGYGTLEAGSPPEGFDAVVIVGADQ